MKVQELLATPDKWTQGAAARDPKGEPVHPFSPDAICWCFGAALRKCYPFAPERNRLRSPILQKLGFDPLERSEGVVPAWNDAPERTHAEVLALCKELDL